MSIPPATSASLNNHPASPFDIIVPNFNMTRYSPLLYEYTYVFLDLVMLEHSSLPNMKLKRKEVNISLLMSITLWIKEYIGIAHRNSVTIRTSQRIEYSMLIKGNNWYRF